MADKGDFEHRFANTKVGFVSDAQTRCHGCERNPATDFAVLLCFAISESGENRRPFTVRLFVESRGRDRQKPHRGIEPRRDCLTLFLLLLQVLGLPGLLKP